MDTFLAQTTDSVPHEQIRHLTPKQQERIARSLSEMRAGNLSTPNEPFKYRLNAARDERFGLSA